MINEKQPSLYQRLRNARKILLIAVPGIGDAFLSTPIVRSIKQSYPNIEIDFLVQEGRESFVEPIPEVHKVITYTHKSNVLNYLKMVFQIFRRYDIAITTKTSDRAALACFYAAPVRLGVVPPLKTGNFWKRILFRKYVEDNEAENIVTQNLKLIDCLGIEKQHSFCFPVKEEEKYRPIPFDTHNDPYVIVHCFGSSAYKSWPEQYWREVIEDLLQRNLSVVLTGGNAREELEIIERITEGFSEQKVFSVAGKLDFAETIRLIQNSQFFVGVDTCMTHFSAACNKPTIALFGPTLDKIWAPWPYQYSQETLQFEKENGHLRNGNVFLAKEECPCGDCPVQCRNSTSEYSKCMEELSPQMVLNLIDDVCGQQTNKKWQSC